MTAHRCSLRSSHPSQPSATPTAAPTDVNRRQFLATAAGTALVPHVGWAQEPPSEIGVGVIGCGGRGGELSSVFGSLPGVRLLGLCDPDAQRVANLQERFPDARGYADLQQLLEDRAIDAVVIATCNHWHCLAAIWALQAGKHVYVEKPLSHSQWEGAQVVAAARKYGKICQIGTQQRSDPMQAEIKKFLHVDQALGDLQMVRANRFGVRGPVGKRTQPLPIPDSVNYDLWLGPAADEPLFRKRLHYDWHWDWNTGSGEMGNWGVHILDDVRNVALQDRVAMPRAVQAIGGRLVWDDAGKTPNIHLAYFDTGTIPVVLGLSNLTASPQATHSPKVTGPASGYVVYADGGRLEGQRSRAVAYDRDGRRLREFKGTSGHRLHQAQFVEAVRQNVAGRMQGGIEQGHYSSGWCNLANIATRTHTGQPSEMAEAIQDTEVWRTLQKEIEANLRGHDLAGDSLGLQGGQRLVYDSTREQFQGDASAANRLLRRSYRRPYEVPEIA